VEHTFPPFRQLTLLYIGIFPGFPGHIFYNAGGATAGRDERRSLALPAVAGEKTDIDTASGAWRRPQDVFCSSRCFLTDRQLFKAGFMLNPITNFIKYWKCKSQNVAADISNDQWRKAEAYLPFLDFLKTEQRKKLRNCAAEFLCQKEFYGAHDLVLTDDIFLVISLQACLPVLNLGLNHYHDWVGIVVYPGGFVVPRREMDENGLVHEYKDELIGEAWENGPVLLAWDCHTDDEEIQYQANVVIHEFAHKLDMSNGGANGLPPLPASMSVMTWSEIFCAAYEQLCDQVSAGEKTLLDPYATEHPAEFFAVVTEAFFETPCLLQQAFPCVYAQLQQLYQLDPASGERHLLSKQTVV